MPPLNFLVRFVASCLVDLNSNRSLPRCLKGLYELGSILDLYINCVCFLADWIGSSSQHRHPNVRSGQAKRASHASYASRPGRPSWPATPARLADLSGTACQPSHMGWRPGRLKHAEMLVDLVGYAASNEPAKLTDLTCQACQPGWPTWQAPYANQASQPRQPCCRSGKLRKPPGWPTWQATRAINASQANRPGSRGGQPGLPTWHVNQASIASQADKHGRLRKPATPAKLADLAGCA